MRSLEPLSSHPPATPEPGGRGTGPARAPAVAAGSAPGSACSSAAGQGNSPPAVSGRRPAEVTRQPLSASFRFEELARQVVITLVRPETGQVVRQIPPERILNLIVQLREAAARLLDKRA